MPDEFLECLEKRKLFKQQLGENAVNRELFEAGVDLASAEKSFADKNWKWSTVQAYYAMFHFARALVLRKGYREKSHYCLLVALRQLFVEENLLASKHADAFEDAMLAREDADYGAGYSKDSASAAVACAREFGVTAKQILRKQKV